MQVSVAYRSYQVICSGPKIDKGRKKKRMQRLLTQKKSMSKGKYAVLLASLQQLTFRGFTLVNKMVAEGENHHVRLGKNEVWADYQLLSYPDRKYIHLIKERNGRWQCICKDDNKPCWQNRVCTLNIPHPTTCVCMCIFTQVHPTGR